MTAGLTRLLQCPEIEKVVHGCQVACFQLKYKWNIDMTPGSLFDTQVLPIMLRMSDHHLPARTICNAVTAPQLDLPTHLATVKLLPTKPFGLGDSRCRVYEGKNLAHIQS